MPSQFGGGKLGGGKAQGKRRGACKAQGDGGDEAGGPWIWRGNFGGRIETPHFPHHPPAAAAAVGESGDPCQEQSNTQGVP